MPYIGEDDNGISMVIFLPPFAAPNALENMLERLTPETLQEAVEDTIQREVEIKLPKFSFEKSYELVPVSTRLLIDCTIYTNLINVPHDFVLITDSEQNGHKRFVYVCIKFNGIFGHDESSNGRGHTQG